MSTPTKARKRPETARKKPTREDQPLPPGDATSRGERRKRETRERLLQAAFRLFAERDADAVPINEITEAADVGFGSFYNHFPSREAIHDELMRRVFEEFADALDGQTVGVEDPAEVIAVSVRHAVLRARREPRWGRLLIRESCRGRILTQGLGARLVRDLQRGLEAGRFKAADPLLCFIMLGSAILGSIAAEVQLTSDDAAALEQLGVSTDGLPERTAVALLQALGLSPAEARTIARRPLPAGAPTPAAALLGSTAQEEPE